MSVIPAQPVEIVRLNKGDNLPDFAVEDFAFKKKECPRCFGKPVERHKDKGSRIGQRARSNQRRNQIWNIGRRGRTYLQIGQSLLFL